MSIFERIEIIIVNNSAISGFPTCRQHFAYLGYIRFAGTPYVYFTHEKPSLFQGNYTNHPSHIQSLGNCETRTKRDEQTFSGSGQAANKIKSPGAVCNLKTEQRQTAGKRREQESQSKQDARKHARRKRTQSAKAVKPPSDNQRFETSYILPPPDPVGKKRRDQLGDSGQKQIGVQGFRVACLALGDDEIGFDR
jgi:hypothetical protein